MAKLTKSVVENIQPETRDVFLWDDSLPGFGIRVLPSGKRSFVLQYRNAERRTRRITLGRFGVLTVQQARQKAIQLLADVNGGGDPAESKRETSEAPTLSDLAGRYLRDHAEPKKKASSVREDRRQLKIRILPVLGTRKVIHITSNDIHQLHASMSDKPVLANRTLALLSMMFRLAEKWGMRPVGSNPCRGVDRYKETPRTRYLTAEELGRLGETLLEMEAEGSTSRSVVAGIRLIILTGCRRDEIRTAMWDEIDLDQRELNLRDSKTGARCVPLNAPAMQIIDGLERRNEWLLPAVRGDEPVNLNTAWNRIRVRARISDVRIHDLRHSFASVGAGAGMSLWQIGKVLGHADSQTTNRYAHAQRDPIHATSEQIASKISALMDGGECAEVRELVAS
jgi:integrase